VDCDFTPEGSWTAAVADKPEQEAALRESAEILAGLGFDLEWREAVEVRRVSGCDRLGGAIFQPRDAGLHSVKLCRGIARLIEGAGGEVRTGFPVRALEPAGDRVLLISDAGQVIAERVVLTVNAYAPALLPHLAGEVRPVRGQILATAPAPRDLPGVWYVNDGFEYLRQLPDGTFLLGGCRWCAVEAEVGYLETPTAKVQGELESFVRDYFPRFAKLPIVHRWAGTMAFTPDGLPRTGDVPGIPGASYFAGFNGHGMSLGFVTGRQLAARALGT
jgi:gamma-glutamylputrescine oxidase